MNAHQRQYLFGSIFIAFSFYQLSISDYLEFSLYAGAGAAFIVNGLTSEPWLERFRKPLVFLSWVLIILTGVLFFYMIRYRYF